MDDGIEVRLVLPRDVLPSGSRPEYFSQLNCELLGLTRRQFLEVLRRPGAPPTAVVGKARLVRRNAMLAFLDRLEGRREREQDETELDGADRVLSEIGCGPSTRRPRPVQR